MFRVRFVLHCVGLLLLSTLFGLKVSRSGGSPGLYAYFTTWMWTLMLVFFSFVSGCIVYPPAWRLFTLLGVSFTHGTCWLVYILYCAVILSNSQPLEQMTHSYGFGVVFIGEKLTHAFPLLSVLTCIGLYLEPIRRESFNPFVHPILWKRILLSVYFYAMPLSFVGIYAAINDPWQVYKSKLTFAESFAICCVILLIVQTLLLLVLFYFRRRSPHKTAYTAGR